jgi:hypothetical protein
MIRSRCNTLFKSKRFGYFLYNALSNTLLEIDKAHFSALEGLRDRNIDSEGFGKGFLTLLRKHKVLVAEGEEKRLLLARQYRRYTQWFDTSRLGLTICPEQYQQALPRHPGGGGHQEAGSMGGIQHKGQRPGFDPQELENREGNDRGLGAGGHG